MSRNTVPFNLTIAPNDIATACGQSNTLRCFDIYYITPWRGMNSPRVLLLRKSRSHGSGVMEFIFAHAWRG